MSKANLPTGYEKRVVAFIDILGFSNFVKTQGNDGFQAIHAALSEVKEYFDNPNKGWSEEGMASLNIDTQTLAVSDCIIISRRVDEKGGVFSMLWDCAFAIHILIRHKFLCRGAITIGDAYHEGNLIFGPAYIAAVEGEKNASYPIVKFSEEVFELAAAFPAPSNEGYGEEEVEFIRSDCKQMEDGSYYLNYFTDYDSRYGPGEGGASLHYENLRQILVQGITNQNLGVFEKYRWAAEQYNLTAHHYELPQVAIPFPPTPSKS